MVYELLDSEGLYLGASSALNVAAAVQLARRLGKGSLILPPVVHHLQFINITHRFKGCHHLVRWSVPLPKQIVFQKMVTIEKFGKRHTYTPDEVCRARLILKCGTNVSQVLVPKTVNYSWRYHNIIPK